MRNLAGRTALVTGAAGGIGLAIARALAERGARVCLADKQANGLDQTAASIGPDASAVFIDLEDVGGMEKAVTEVTGPRFSRTLFPAFSDLAKVDGREARALAGSVGEVHQGTRRPSGAPGAMGVSVGERAARSPARNRMGPAR